MRPSRMRGFSLIEMLIVIAVIIIMSSFAVMQLWPVAKQTKVTNAYNTTLMTMRQAREQAVSERRTYIVNFNSGVAPNRITITQASTGVVTLTRTLPNDITFRAEPGIPATVATTPDHFGNGSVAIDFDQNVGGGVKTAIYFYPDGSAQDVNNNTNNGVIYLARAGELYSSRAITLWGATGRIRGWRLNAVGGVPTWSQQ